MSLISSELYFPTLFFSQMAGLRLQANLAGTVGLSVRLLPHQFYISIRAERAAAGVST